jgi:hypothetical protein
VENPTTPDNLGGLVLPPVSQDTGSGAPTSGVSASAEIVKQRKKRSDAGGTRGARNADGSASVPSVSTALSAQQFAQLYSPALWEKAVCAPADAIAAISGKKLWEISPREREAVGASCSIAAQCFAVTDPRWLAASLAIVTVLDIYGVRLAMELADRAAARKEKEEKKKAASGFVQQT